MKIALATENSGGFGNRLFAWQCVYEIAKINNAEIETDWKELSHINLPNTTYNLNFDDYVEIKSKLIPKDFILNPNLNYKETSGFNYSRHFENNYKKDSLYPIRKMTLKDKNIFGKIKNIIANDNVVGVHVRKRDISLINQKISDSWYLSLMDEIVKFNKEVKFYISSDVVEKDLQSYYSNFDCINYKHILPNIKKVVLQDNITAQLNTDLAGIVDFFSLSETKLLLCSISTWSMNAYKMHNIPIVFPKGKNCNYQPLENSIVQYKDSIIEKKLTINDILL